MRQEEVAGVGPAGRDFVRALFATPADGDMSGIVIGARTGSSDGRGGQYSVFYDGVPYGAAFNRTAWIDALRQDEENRSNLVLVNTGEVNSSDSIFNLQIYDGVTGGIGHPHNRHSGSGPRLVSIQQYFGELHSGYNSRVCADSESIRREPFLGLRRGQ